MALALALAVSSQTPQPPLELSKAKITSQNHFSRTKSKTSFSNPYLLHQHISHLCSTTSTSLDSAFQLFRYAFFNSTDLSSLASAAGVLIHECGRREAIDIGRKVHSLISSSSSFNFLLVDNSVLTTRLLTMYSNCGFPDTARQVFDSLPVKNVFHYNAMVSALARNQMWSEAIELFVRMLSVDGGDGRDVILPDNFTLPCVLKSCAGLSKLNFGEATHGMAIKLSLCSDTYVNNSLISMYVKCGCVDNGCKVFETMPSRNSVSWNTMMSGLSENGLVRECFYLFIEMMVSGEECSRLDDATVVTLLPACARDGLVDMGRVVHGLSVKLNLCNESRVNNALIDMYAKCGWLMDAQQLFYRCLERDVVSWNAMIGGCSSNGDIDGTFSLLQKMHADGVKADEITILNILPACTMPSKMISVKELHSYVIRHQLESNELVPHSLMAAYAKCGSLNSAKITFRGTKIRTVSTWNAVIGGCAQNGEPGMAVELYLKMINSSVDPDWFTIGSLLLACTHLKDFQRGRSVHGYAVRNGLNEDSFIAISLLSLYVQCGKAATARFVFNAMDERDPVSWNAMIAGYSQNEMPDECLDLFRQMQKHAYHQPSSIATMSACSACSQLSSLRLGKEAHCYALKENFTYDTYVSCSIIEMYAKCGSIASAYSFFNRLENKDVVSYTVMITAYAIHGFGIKAIKLYSRMQMEGLKPDECTYLGILMACSHSGLVEEGLNFLEEMKTKHGLVPRLEHHACVADMLGRAGQLTDAVNFIDNMPEEPDDKIWAALLDACRNHSDIVLGEQVANKLLQLEPHKAEHYVLASNLFARFGRWEDVRKLRNRLKEIGLNKDPGCSWMDLGGKVFRFLANDHRLPESNEIRTMWLDLEEKIRAIGYKPDTKSVLHELSEEEKVELLRGHSEKQAIAFALLKMNGSTTVRVCKNIRICRDCHNAIKLITRVVEREFVVRDNKRFHHFKNGLCSCRDYW